MSRRRKLHRLDAEASRVHGAVDRRWRAKGVRGRSDVEEIRAVQGSEAVDGINCVNKDFTVFP